MSGGFRRFLLLPLFIAVAACAGPTTVTMHSGERIIGTLSPQSNETILVLQSAMLGELKLQKKDIASIEGQQPESAAAKPQPRVEPEPELEVELELSDEEVAMVKQKRLIDQFREVKTPKSWKGNLRMGMNLSRGDSRWTETFARGTLTIDPERSRNFYRFSGSYTYRETEGGGSVVKSTDRYDANLTYRRDLSDHWFLQNSIAGRADSIRGIDHEIQELVGLGYRFRPSESSELIVGSGGGIEDFEASIEDSRTGLNPVANFFQEFTWRPLEKATFRQEFNYFLNPDNEEQHNYVFQAAFRYRITDLLGLEFSYNKNFDNDVGDGSSKDDANWRNAIIIYF